MNTLRHFITDYTPIGVNGYFNIVTDGSNWCGKLELFEYIDEEWKFVGVLIDSPKCSTRVNFNYTTPIEYNGFLKVRYTGSSDIKIKYRVISNLEYKIEE